MAQDAERTLEEALAALAESAAGPEEVAACLHEVMQALGRSGADADEPSDARYPDGLTAREVEVLRLLAGGRANKEIAAALVVTIHTVERHLANIYGKIGVHNRTSAIRFALEHDLIPSEKTHRP